MKYLNNTVVTFRTALRVVVLLPLALVAILGNWAGETFDGLDPYLPGMDRWQK